MTTSKRIALTNKIIASLEEQGFVVENGSIVLSANGCKNDLRLLHQEAVKSKRMNASRKLIKNESQLLQNIASGEEIIPDRISPYLREVKRNTNDELLFRYACLHWSIPVSSGYGRRLRYLIYDNFNGKLIGLFGLGDPVFSMRARDGWIGWCAEDRRKRLKYVMDAFVLGAVPPYSYLLGGKLVAMLTACNEVQDAFREKYIDRRSLINGNNHDGRLAMITTTSALGRSSIYNRLKYKDRLMFHSVGFTSGSGEFHFANGIYEELSEYVNMHCKPTAKNELWGKGFRNRREVVRKGLVELGLSPKLAFHQVKREIFVAKLANNSCAFLRGEESDLLSYNQSAVDIFNWYRERWLLPRAERNTEYRAFNPENWRLW